MTPRLVATPETCGGAPRLAGHRLSVDVITGRFAAGDTIGDIAKDYDITAGEVIMAIRAVVQAARGRDGLLASIERRLLNNIAREAKDGAL